MLFSTPIRSFFSVSIRSHITKDTMGSLIHCLTMVSTCCLDLFCATIKQLFWVKAGSEALDLITVTGKKEFQMLSLLKLRKNKDFVYSRCMNKGICYRDTIIITGLLVVVKQCLHEKRTFKSYIMSAYICNVKYF